jgi:hypothetical protein
LTAINASTDDREELRRKRSWVNWLPFAAFASARPSLGPYRDDREELRRRNAELEAENAALKAQLKDAVSLLHELPTSGLRRSTAEEASAKESQPPMTPEEVLTCDVCRLPIDDLRQAMVWWDYADRDARGSIGEFRLSHKGRCNDEKLGLAETLWWFADRESGMRRLADLVLGYEWTAAQLKRLVLLAWAIALVATPQDRKLARGGYE